MLICDINRRSTRRVLRDADLTKVERHRERRDVGEFALQFFNYRTVFCHAFPRCEVVIVEDSPAAA